MKTITIPEHGRPTEPTDSTDLIGVDGNAFAIVGATTRMLAKAGASASFVAAYKAEAVKGDYDHLLAASIAYLDHAVLDPPDGIVR